MLKFYHCVTAWKRHSLGEIIPENEYNKLPHEIKQNGNFKLIEPVADLPESIPAPQVADIEPEIVEVVEQTPVDILKDIDIKPKYRYNKKES